MIQENNVLNPFYFIGEIFEFEGKTLKTIEQTINNCSNDCSLCYFEDKCSEPTSFSDPIIPQCLISERKDSIRVYFQEIEPELEENYSPYCPLCESCGEEGCCSHLHCFRALIESNPKCAYGSHYLREAIFNKRLVEFFHKMIDSITKGELNPKNIVELYNIRWNKIYDEVYEQET